MKISNKILDEDIKDYTSTIEYMTNLLKNCHPAHKERHELVIDRLEIILNNLYDLKKIFSSKVEYKENDK